MDKDAYYFPHFSNARQDRKIKRVRKELGLEGYGIYFMLLETLRDEAGFKFPVKDVDLLADEFGTSEQKVRAVVANYELFQVDEKEQFFSVNMINFLQPYIDKKIQAKEAITLRWARKKIEQGKDISDLEANLIRTYNERNTSCNTNKTKLKETKLNKTKLDKKDIKHKHGEYKHVLLTCPEVEKLNVDFGTPHLASMIMNLDEYIETTGKVYKNHNLVMRKWEKNKPTEQPKKKQETIAEMQARMEKEGMFEGLQEIINDS